MKKISILFAALAAFTFSSCSKTEVYEASDGAKDFAISALITKTVNDGASTEWNAGDAINVFHASAGTTTYGTNDKFTIAEEDLGTGTFRGTLSEGQYDSNDWYAFYPYKSNLTTPANTGVCYFNIGCKNSSSAAQVQNGNNSTAHLCGEYFPMWAQAKAVAKGSGISLTFNNAVSVVKFHVTNKTSKPITVTSLSITAEQDIIGSYHIDFSGDAPAFKSSGASYVAKEAKLNVSNGTALDVNVSADFYLAIKPFNNEAGKEITFNVNGCEKTITTAESFKSGNIKTVNFSYDKEAEDLSGDYLITGKSGEDIYAMGLYSSGNNNIKAVTTPLAFVEGGKVLETDEIAQAKVTITKITEGDYAGMYSIKDSNDKYLYAAGNGANQLKVQESIDNNAAWAINKDKDGYSIVASKSSNRNILMFNASNNPKLFSCYSGGQSPVSLLSYSNVIPDTTPAIQGIEDPETVSAEGGDVDVQYTIKNPVEGKTITATKEVGADWISLNTSTANLIKVSVSANSTANERSSVVTVSYPGAESVTFTVTQAAAGAKKSIVLDLTQKTVGSNVYNATTTYGDWKIVYGANNNKGWAYFKMGGKNTTISTYNPCYIYYTKEVSDKIDEITVHIVSESLSKSGMSVNSWGVYIYSDEELKTQVDYVAGGTITKNEGSFSFKPTEGKTWQNCWVKVSWDLANTTSTNGIVCVDNITIKL